jgi:hypothetical protein
MLAPLAGNGRGSQACSSRDGRRKYMVLNFVGVLQGDTPLKKSTTSLNAQLVLRTAQMT